MDAQFYPLFRSASIDSDATADNLPGPGRNLGRLIEHLGGKLETRIYTFVARQRTYSLSGANAATTSSYLNSTDSIDTNATADNLPGPGRNLGRLYGYLGDKFVNNLSRFLARLGYGPDSVATAIARVRRHTERDIRDLYVAYAMQSGSWGTLTEAERMKLRKSCKRLVKYSRSKADSTAISACNHIADLALHDPYLKQILFECLPAFDQTLVADLHRDVKESWLATDVDPLLASSRKALISVTEVELQKNWSEFYLASALGGPITMDQNTWFTCMDLFLRNFNQLFLHGGFEMSFLGLRHIFHNFQTTTDFVTTTHDDERWASRSDDLINVIHHLLSALNLWLQFAVRDDVSTSAIDWETLEALVGTKGQPAAWMTRLQGVVTDGLDFGKFTNGVVDEIYNIFDYEVDDVVLGLQALCQQKGRSWVPPVLYAIE